MSDRAKTFAFVLVGMFLLQAAWILAVPAFRGSDEHDHAYKAAAVARGDWSASHPVEPGQWGDLVVVPRDIVVAARSVCESLDYTTSLNCRPGRSLNDGEVEVTSSAARYNPVFYFVIGTAARPFSGDAALFVMRSVTAVLCALLMAVAAATLRGREGDGRWAVVGLVAATSPIVAYSTSVAAPNGIEMASAAVVWAAGSRLAMGREDDVEVRRLVLTLAAGAVPLAIVRTLGPLWLLLILSVIVMAFGTVHLRPVIRRASGRAAIVAISIALIYGVAWSLAGSTNAPPSSDGTSMPGSGWRVLPGQVLLWLLQSVGAFPLRTEAAPTLVYAVVLSGWAVLFGAAMRRASWPLRRSMLSVIAVSVLVPSAVTIATYASVGPAWQGRYTYPFSMGALLLAGLALDQAGTPSLERMRTVGWFTIAGVAFSEFASIVRVMDISGPMKPLAESSFGSLPPGALIAVLTLLGAIGLGGAILCTTAVDPAETKADRTVHPDNPGARVGG